MTAKDHDNLLPLRIDTNTTPAAVSSDHKDFVFDKVLFDADALSSLQSIFASAEAVGTKSASVKFMITSQDEADLQSLGYSKEQIDRLKPQEAADIIQSMKNDQRAP